MAGWRVLLKESAVDDLQALGRKAGRSVLKEASRRLETDPSYRVLFNVNRPQQRVTIVLVGEKRGDALIVQGRRFTEHHESDPIE